jgi:S-adenosylmethionine:tRNA ribosyltransferase-isomerase
MGDWPTSGGLCGSTKLMISPPHDFSLVDGLLTNFHLPKSTLLALVAAMIGIDKLRDSYDEAMEGGYRFYSYGDAMFVPPK